MDLVGRPPPPPRPTRSRPTGPGPPGPLVAPRPPRDGPAPSPPVAPGSPLGIVESPTLRRVRGRPAEGPTGRPGVDTADVVHSRRVAGSTASTYSGSSGSTLHPSVASRVSGPEREGHENV